VVSHSFKLSIRTFALACALDIDAASAKNIKTIAEKREDPMEAKVRQLSEEIAKLKAALEAASSLPREEAADNIADLTEEERMEYLEALSTQMNFDLGNRASRFSRQSSSVEGSCFGGTPFPQLTCLNKDEVRHHDRKQLLLTFACFRLWPTVY
jgi:hypothetical protein